MKGWMEVESEHRLTNLWWYFEGGPLRRPIQVISIFFFSKYPTQRGFTFLPLNHRSIAVITLVKQVSFYLFFAVLPSPQNVNCHCG